MLDNPDKERLKFITDTDGVTVFAEVLPGAEAFEYSDQWMQDQLHLQGYDGLSMRDDAQQEIAQLCAENRKGMVKAGQKIDARVETILSRDLLSATLRITTAKGGKQADTEAVMKALNDNGIELKMVNKNRVVGLLRKSQLIAPGESVEVVVAKGVASVHGKDTWFECLVDGATKRKPHERADGSLDYYDLGEIPSVEAGCPLMRKHPPQPAIIGRGVTGQELPAKIGKKINFKKSKGVVISPDDPDLLIAAIKGQPVFSTHSVHVERIYTLKRVDVHSGHIDYDGSLVVKGDVVSGMKIKVTGDVQVFGMVENALIDAGGNVDIKLGAVGHTDDKESEGKMHITCQGNLTAGYLENALINVYGDVVIKSRISNCEVRAEHQVIVGNQRQEKSGIVGGHIAAGSVIRAEVLGSSGGAITHASITCSEGVLKQVAELKLAIVEHDELLMQKLGKMVGLSKKHTEEANQELHRLKVETEQIKEEIKELLENKAKLDAVIANVSKGRIIVQKEAFPGVTLKILDQDKTIKSRFGAGAFLLFDGLIAHNSTVT